MKKETNSEMAVRQVNVGQINFIDIFNHPSVNLWMEHLNSTSFKQFVRLFCDNNGDRFLKLVGDPLPFIPKNINNNWGKCWKVNKEHLNWLICSGNEGTIFLVETSLTPEEFKAEAKIGIAIIKFLDFLKDKLCNNEI